METPPALLAMMEEKRSADRAADRATRALPADWSMASSTVPSALGMTLTMRDEGQVMELVAPVSR